MLLGKNGQLGLAFTKLLATKSVDFQALSRAEADLEDTSILANRLAQFRPDVTINCAAYTDVNTAERNPSLAMAVNYHAVKELAKYCEAIQSKLVHFSTDYVFDGTKGRPYIETDATNPLNVYGKSKLLGEEAVTGSSEPWLVFRTSWVYGEGTNNFISKLRSWAKGNEVLRIVDDEISVPTSTRDIAKFTYLSIEKGISGLFHLTSSGKASRYQYALAIQKVFPEIRCAIEPARLSEFASEVARPSYSVLSNQRLAKVLETEIPHWQTSLDDSTQLIRS